MNVNKVFICGNVVADPELRTTPTGQAVTTLRVATNRFWADKAGQRQQAAEFHNVVLWGKQAQVASQFLTKGGTVFIEGRLQTRSWTDKNGQMRYITEIVAEGMQLGPRTAGVPQGGGTAAKSSSGPSGQPQASEGQVRSEAQPQPEEEIPVINMDEEEAKADDLPF